MKQAIALVLFLALSGSLAAQSTGQSIAEAARRERARRQTTQSKAVFSPETLAPSTVTPNPVEVPQPVPGVEKAGEAAPPAEPKGPVDKQGRDEQWWRNTFSTARTELTRAESRLLLIDLKLKQLNAELLANSAMYNRENRIGALLTTTKAELVSAREQVEAAKQKIADLEEDLRRSGGFPGWAR